MFSITDPDPYDAKQVGRIKKKFPSFFPIIAKYSWVQDIPHYRF
jgi:hypothetical protein